MVEVAFYGDDFTGSTDALAQFTRLGFRGILLVTMPAWDELQALARQYDVIGVAGIARSLPPDEQEAEIRPILQALRDLGPHFVQYKVCSTADSSPTLGSIGCALEVGRSIFGPAVVPILIAQPDLGRYTVFSHHFAAEAGTTHRLDRQPTMSSHPTTPMHESDLRRHLVNQTNLRIGAVHLTSYPDLPAHDTNATYDALILDALTDADLQSIAHTILTPPTTPTFAIGSGGLSRALALALTSPPPTCDHPDPTPSAADSKHPKPSTPPSDPPTTLTDQSPTRDRTITPPADSSRQPATSTSASGLAAVGHPTTRPKNHAMPGRGDRAQVSVAGQVLVVSGSQSPRTAEQIAHAVASGWHSLPLTYRPAAAPDSSPSVVTEAVRVLKAGAPGVVVHTGEAIGRAAGQLLGAFSKELAAVVREVVRTTQVRRVVVAGGDTSGRVLRELGVTALEPSPTIPPHLGQGLTLCTAISTDPMLRGIQFLLKGGQLGDPNLFARLRHA
ncbi:four-carbon acid sugar kinase family protein [Kribbella pittospori]|uniref:Four-carbon acid sugar kinase family protein n=1 Tax=Kribbella pittospori TaxID=722689 RepID=A0A4R0KP96_9ACTN|nr:four-carbon acid sugar kinase family protein [Kribbella pittospori]TCC62179.1 four-carbon acid sugar kinase family protein [Kribbella pittospori]